MKDFTKVGRKQIWFDLKRFSSRVRSHLPPFSLIRDFGKQNTRGNVSKIFGSLACYWQIGSKSTNWSHYCDLLTFSTSCYRAVIGGFRSDLSITVELCSLPRNSTKPCWSFEGKTCLFTGTASEFNNAKAWKMTEVGNKLKFRPTGKL